MYFCQIIVVSNSIIINHLIFIRCNEEILYFINHVFAGNLRMGS